MTSDVVDDGMKDHELVNHLGRRYVADSRICADSSLVFAKHDFVGDYKP